MPRHRRGRRRGRIHNCNHKNIVQNHFSSFVFFLFLMAITVSLLASGVTRGSPNTSFYVGIGFMVMMVSFGSYFSYQVCFPKQETQVHTHPTEILATVSLTVNQRRSRGRNFIAPTPPPSYSQFHVHSVDPPAYSTYQAHSITNASSPPPPKYEDVVQLA